MILVQDDRDEVVIDTSKQGLMSETRATMSSNETPPQSSELPTVSSSSKHNFFVNFDEKVKEFLKLLKPIKKDDDITISGTSRWKDRDASALELNLEKQLRPWRENPVWVDHPPDIKVTIPKGSLCNLNLCVDVGLPPDAVYNIVTDPDNKRVFKNIKEVISRKVIVDEGLRQVVEVEQAAIWRFLWWTGTISVHILVDQNREDYSMKFKQIKSGFMERFEGYWRMEPIFVDEELCHPIKPRSLTEYISCTKGKGRVASRLSLDQLLQPSIVPPPPISWYVRGITTKTTEMLINDLLAEAVRIRQDSDIGNSDVPDKQSGGSQLGTICNIKERWAQRRKATKNVNRRLP